MSDPLAASYAILPPAGPSPATNFYYSFLVLPRQKRRAMCALYAFLRHTDDLGDNDQPVDRSAAALGRLAASRSTGALTGEFDSPLLPGAGRHGRPLSIPPDYLHDVIDGVEMDLDHSELRRRSTTWPTTATRSPRSWDWLAFTSGAFHDPRALEPACRCGLAFQLTNILRDLKEDADRGRVYLPQEDLQRFGYTSDDLRQEPARRAVSRPDAIRDRPGRTALSQKRPNSTACLSVRRQCRIRRRWSRIYRGLLDEIKRLDGDVFTRRVRLSPWRKLRHRRPAGSCRSPPQARPAALPGARR